MKKSSCLFVYTVCMCTVLSAQVPGQAGVRSAQNNFNQYLNKKMVESATRPGSAGIINAFNNEENTIGKRFVFDEWVQGDSVVDGQGNLINTEAFLFNFDKISGSLLATQDKVNNMLVTSGGIRSFILKSRGRKYYFMHVNTIDAGPFFLELVKSNDRYSLYKKFSTKYIAANFRNDGVIQSGNSSNEYKDEHQYYVIDAATNKSQQVNLKPKVLKTVFAADKEKVNSYFKEHNSSEIDEQFLYGLVTYLNQ